MAAYLIIVNAVIAVLMLVMGIPSAVLALRNIPAYPGYPDTACITSFCYWNTFTFPPYADFGDLKSIGGAGIINAIAGFFSGWFLLADQANIRDAIILILSPAAVISSLVAFAYSFKATYSSDTPYQGPFPHHGHHYITDRGSYSLEAWTCGLKDVGRLPHLYYDEFASTCYQTRAARWMMFPLFLLSGVFLILFLILWRKYPEARPKSPNQPTKTTVKESEALDVELHYVPPTEQTQQHG